MEFYFAQLRKIKLVCSSSVELLLLNFKSKFVKFKANTVILKNYSKIFKLRHFINNANY